MSPEHSKPRIMPGDGDARRRAIEETGHSFVMEASAGTGKTHTLISRILHLVLEKGPCGSPLRLSEICAITFTEKAAGEMKVRLRQYLEQKLLDPKNLPVCHERARNALHDLETASISTFHSFAVGLLKERPIEAGLDPHFSALDEIQSELYFKKTWESWISHALEKRDPVLEKALRNGFHLQSLENLARILRLNWLTVRDLDCDSPPSDEEYLGKIQIFLDQSKEYFLRVKDPEDRLAILLEKAMNWLEQPDRDAAALGKPGRTGAAGKWEGGKDTVEAVQEFLREVSEFITAYGNLPVQRLLDEIVRWMIQSFVKKTWEEKKKTDGYLDFDDQLYLARKLLRDHSAVRQEFRSQYKTLLIDEFQDTDAIQLDIVRLLSSKGAWNGESTQLRPEPGRLFIVGDPKQSIYRFRNADIETYLGLVDENNLGALGVELLRLTTNFRSVPSILSFVDDAFKGAMQVPEDGGKYQPRYLAFEDYGARKFELNPPAVSLLGDIRGEDASKRSVREFVELESRRIAKLIHEICGSEPWKVQDANSTEGSLWRVARYGDIAILLPVLSHADVLEDALRDLDIPYVLEGGKFYYSRSEVSSAITVLRAVANPNDEVALYGSLRSIFFGFSDEDLLKTHMEGIALDYRKPLPADSSLHLPFSILRDLHRNRHERRASETFEILLQKTGAREVLAVRGCQSLANLNKVGRTLRALQGEASFSQVVDLLGTMDEDGLAESESRLMEERSDAVRIMSIHKSKGLDFPIVFVASLGLKKQARTKNLLTDLHDRKIFALKMGSRESGLQTAGWDGLVEKEKKRDEAELVRLLYVGLTRARDHLILSTHTGGWKKPEGGVAGVPDMEGTRLKPLGIFLKDCHSGNSSLARLIDTASLDSTLVPSKSSQASIPKDWGSIAEREYGELRALIGNTPSASNLQMAGEAPETGRAEDSPPEARMPEAAQNRQVRLGTAFHEAMERVDFFSRDGWMARLQELSMRHRLDRESALKLREMIEICLTSGLMERARSTGRSGGKILREVPFVRPIKGSAIEEGKIDLLFEEGDGWVLVDYKTDWVSKERESMETFFQQKYSSQIREYLEALKNLSVKVHSAYLLLARTGDAIKML